MKRFVSYLYSIYNNQKIHNAGFARVELRTGRNRIDIHLRENGYAGKLGTVYLFTRKQENIQGVSIGNIIFRGNQADFRYEQSEENIGQTSWQIDQMNGILIMIDERIAFLSQWDEQPVDTMRFEVWKADQIQEEKKEEDRNTAESETVMKSKQSGQNRENTVSVNQQKQESENSDVNNEQTKQQGNLEMKTERPKHNIYTNNEQSYQNTDANNEQSYQNIDANTIQSHQKEAMATHRQMTQQYNESDANDMHQRSEVLNNEKPSDLQTTELQPQLSANYQWDQIWRYMLRTYPVLKQFAEDNDVLCVRIEIKDVRLLPEKYWSMINNSFLLHGFFNYRHLAFGRIGQNWFVGIPGIYQSQEHVMASIFGFPDFLPQIEQNERGEQPGYWYRILEIE